MDRRLLSDQAYDVLLRRVVRGEMAPGERINVDAIAEELRISRTPVREAVTKLSWMRFASVERNARTMVAEWTAEDMRHRLIVVGRLAALMAADPELPLDELGAAVEGAEDVDAYLGAIEYLVGRASNRVAAHAVADHVVPLRMYFDVLESAHGITCRASAGEREEALRAMRAGCASGDRQAVGIAVNAYTELLAAALRAAEAPV
ncbi:GntR family transcriptional regulator [Curtobacterium sp. VKM Ac-2887]|nr:GntR family transcriptional regulator [Curtobacterium sp. VKM Ac-2887]